MSFLMRSTRIVNPRRKAAVGFLFRKPRLRGHDREPHPDYLSGAGYLLTKLAAECIHQEGMKEVRNWFRIKVAKFEKVSQCVHVMPMFPPRRQDLSLITIEDAFITGNLAERCSVSRVHHPGFVYNINLRRDVVSLRAETVVPSILSLLCRSLRESRFSRAGGTFCGTT